MNKRAVAFLVAPLTVPVLGLPYVLSLMTGTTWIVLGIVVATILAYVGVLVIGAPLLMFLWGRQRTALWVTSVAGGVGGMLTWTIFGALFPLLLDQGFSGVRRALTVSNMLNGVIWPGGVLGVVVGIVLWLIARPDKES
jgi:hypothetical protein